MDINKLRSIIATVKYGSVSEASYNLYTVQSTITKNIQAVEKELGVKLFRKSGRKLLLTQTGQKLFPYIEKAVTDYDLLINKSSKISNKCVNRISIHSTPIRSGIAVLEMIKEFKKNYPGIEIELNESSLSEDIYNGLQTGSVDVAIIVQTFVMNYDCSTSHSFVSNKFILQPMLKDYYFAVLYKSHPLAKKKEISLLDFQTESFISVGEKFEKYHSMLNKISEMYDIDFNIISYVDSISSVIDMVNNELGISILSSRVLTSQKNIVIKPIKEDLYRITSVVVNNKRELIPQLKWFIDYATNHYKITSKLQLSDMQ